MHEPKPSPCSRSSRSTPSPIEILVHPNRYHASPPSARELQIGDFRKARRGLEPSWNVVWMPFVYSEIPRWTLGFRWTGVGGKGTSSTPTVILLHVRETQDIDPSFRRVANACIDEHVHHQRVEELLLRMPLPQSFFPVHVSSDATWDAFGHRGGA